MIFGLEALPPNVVYSMKVNNEKPFVMKADHFQFLIDYYNVSYVNYSDSDDTGDIYVGGANGGITSSLLNPIFVSNFIYKFKSVSIFGCSYMSAEGTASLLKRGSHVMAYCRNNPGGNTPISSLRPAQIMYFFRHKTDVRDDDGNPYLDQIHTFAYLRFYKQSTIALSAFQEDNMGTCQNKFEDESVMSIVPLMRIYSPIAIKFNHFDNINVYITMPRNLMYE